MIAYKAFDRNLSCRGKQYAFGMWHTEAEANCARNGIHCATNPLDCLDYYTSRENRRLCLVEVAGDLNEDDVDSKVTGTRMRILKELDDEETAYAAALYIVEHPELPDNRRVRREEAVLSEYPDDGFVIVRGKHPAASAPDGTIVALVREAPGSVAIDAVNMFTVGRDGYLPDRIYSVEDY